MTDWQTKVIKKEDLHKICSIFEDLWSNKKGEIFYFWIGQILTNLLARISVKYDQIFESFILRANVIEGLLPNQYHFFMSWRDFVRIQNEFKRFQRRKSNSKFEEFSTWIPNFQRLFYQGEYLFNKPEFGPRKVGQTKVEF